MQGFRSLSVLFDGPNELEWIDFIEVEVGKSSLWDMVFLQIVNVALMGPINIDSQFKLFR